MTGKISIENIANYGNLLIAHAHARKGKGHYSAVKRFEKNQTELLHKLESTILSGNFRTSKYKEKVINDSGKERLIAKLPYYPDRVTHWAIMQQLEEPLLLMFSPHSHAAIPNEGIHKALFHIRQMLLQHPELKFCLKIDVKKYFPHIDKEILKRMVRDLIDADEGTYALLEENIDSYSQGIPIGNYTSQYWANFYLTPFDNELEKENQHDRYMDDCCILGRTAAELHKLRVEIVRYLRDELHLEIKENWQVFPIDSRGIDYVGYRTFSNRVLLRKSTFKKMRRVLLKVRRKAEAGIFGERERSQVASYAGWVKYCTPRIRVGLYNKYIKPILVLIPGELKFKMKIYNQVFRHEKNLHNRKPAGKPHYH